MTTERLGPAVPRLLVLALAMFAGVTSETLPVGLLPQIASSIGTSEALAGTLVGLYATIVAVLAVPLAIVTRRLPRKALLLISTGTFLACNVLSAVAPSFAVLAAARVVGGVSHAVYFAVIVGYATRLVPAETLGRALAVLSAGISAGFVLGVPLATLLGQAIGWRGAFGSLAVLMLAVLALAAWALPAVPVGSTREETRPGRAGRFAAAVVAGCLIYLAHYTLYTYVAVLLTASGLPTGAVGPMLLVLGAAGIGGLALVGRHLDARFRASALVVLGVLLVGLAGVAIGFPALPVVLVAAIVWNAAFGAVAPVHGTAAIRAEAVGPDIAGASVVAASNVGIAGGAILGGAVLGAGLAAVAWAAVVATAAAGVLVLLARGAFPSRF